MQIHAAVDRWKWNGYSAIETRKIWIFSLPTQIINILLCNKMDIIWFRCVVENFCDIHLSGTTLINAIINRIYGIKVMRGIVLEFKFITTFIDV